MNARDCWSKLAFNGLVGPFAGLASALGLGWLAILLYIDAAVSPAGTGLLYTGTSSRLFYAMSRGLDAESAVVDAWRKEFRVLEDMRGEFLGR